MYDDPMHRPNFVCPQDLGRKHVLFLSLSCRTNSLPLFLCLTSVGHRLCCILLHPPEREIPVCALLAHSQAEGDVICTRLELRHVPGIMESTELWWALDKHAVRV